MASKNNPLPTIFRFAFEDYAALGPTFKNFLDNLNLYTLPVYNLINGGLTFPNMERAIYSQKNVVAGNLTPLSFANPLSIAPSGVTVVQAQWVGGVANPLTTAISAANWSFDGKRINILNIAGLVSGGIYNLSLEVF